MSECILNLVAIASCEYWAHNLLDSEIKRLISIYSYDTFSRYLPVRFRDKTSDLTGVVAKEIKMNSVNYIYYCRVSQDPVSCKVLHLNRKKSAA